MYTMYRGDWGYMSQILFLTNYKVLSQKPNYTNSLTIVLHVSFKHLVQIPPPFFIFAFSVIMSFITVLLAFSL